MSRILGIVVLVGLMAGIAPADVLVIKSGRKKFKVLGLPETVDDTDVTASNWRLFLSKSTGVIVEDNYDSIVWKKRATSKKTTTYQKADVVAIGMAPLQRDISLEQGYSDLATGNLANALRNFQATLKNPEARPVDKHDANFMIGFSHLSFGRTKSARAHFAKWNGGNSVYTPKALDLLAQLYTGVKKYSDARATYERIQALPEIPTDWQFKARCGLVKVLNAERKYAAAQKLAATIASEASRDKANASSMALAMGLQAQAITFAADEASYPKAEKLLTDAIDAEGVDKTTLAFLNLTLGDSLYAQDKLDEARYPYLRVPALYPEESGYCGAALLNAGQCFIDMSDRAATGGDQKRADTLLVDAMKLLSESGLTYKNRGARGVWKKHKTAWKEAKIRLEKK